MASESPVLLGDSLCCRLYARNASIFHPLSSRTCVSGQTVKELYDVVVPLRQQLLGRRVVLLIGTIDVLRRNSLQGILKHFIPLVKLLRRLKCQITLCELLPIPKLGKKSQDPTLLGLNKFIRTYEPSGVRVIHSHDLFCSGPEGTIKSFLYCKYLGRSGSRRVDLVHPNSDGLDCLLLSLEA